MWMDLINLAGLVALMTYLVGVGVRLVWMLIRGYTPRYQGLPRPYTSEEYFYEPLGWPLALIWWVLMLKNR